MGLKPILRTTTTFSALILLVGSFDPLKPVPDMTYNVFSGTLNPTQSTMSCNVVFSVCSCLERMVCRVWKTWKTPGILFCQICKHPNSSSDNMKL